MKQMYELHSEILLNMRFIYPLKLGLSDKNNK